MKRVTRLLLAFMLFFVTLISVNAKEVGFNYDWEKETKKIYEVDENQNMSYKEGYVIFNITGIEYPITEITYYNYKGEVISSKNINNIMFFYMFNVDDYIYAIAADYENDYQLFIVKYNDNLKEEARMDLDEEYSSVLAPYIFYSYSTNGLNPVSVTENKINLISNGVLFHFDKDLKSLSTEEITEENEESIMEKYYADLYDLYTNVYSKGFITSPMYYDMNSENKVLGGINSSCEGNVKGSCPSWATISLLDKNNKEIWNKKLSEYTIIASVKLIDEYIVAIGYTISDYDDIESEIIILDMEGNIVQTISAAGKTFQSITSSKYGFITNKTSGYCNILGGISEGVSNGIETYDMVPPSCKVTPVAYYLPRNIETKVIGEGVVNIVDTSRNGEEVTYEVTPKAGYVLGVVKVMDKEGNIVEFKNNKFTMPASDVTIEVTFLAENPETTDIAIITFFVIFIAGLFCTITNYKKLQFLK